MKPEHKKARLDAMPLLVAANGARDRAAHYDKPVGAVVCDCKLDINLVGLVPESGNGLSKELAARVGVATKRFIILFETCAQAYANEVSRLLDNRAPGALDFDHTANVHIARTDDPMTKAVQDALLKEAPADILDTLSVRTADIVEQWSAKAAS